jgi:hypothetical protein
VAPNHSAKLSVIDRSSFMMMPSRSGAKSSVLVELVSELPKFWRLKHNSKSMADAHRFFEPLQQRYA